MSRMKKWKCQKIGWYTLLLKRLFCCENWPSDLLTAFTGQSLDYNVDEK